MTVPIPVTETTITTAWGTAVANDVNGLLSRMTGAEADIDALQERVGGARSKSGTVLIPGDGNAFTIPFASELVALNDVSYSAGVFTVAAAGIYSVNAYVNLDNGFANVLTHILSISGVSGFGGWMHTDSSFLVSWTGFMAASATAKFEITRANVGTTGSVGSGQFHIYKVGP